MNDRHGELTLERRNRGWGLFGLFPNLSLHIVLLPPSADDGSDD